jgi:type I restriction enzyme S subunit
MIGTVGEVCLIEQEPDFAIKNVGLLKNEDYLRARWLYFYLTSPQAQAQIKERLRGTTQQYLPLGEIRKFPIILPQDRSVMQSIVEILGALHDKIRLNHKINQTLEQMAQAIFKSWFVDFEPVKAKITVLEAGGSAEDALLAAMQAISGKNEAQLTLLQAEQPEQYAELRATAELFPSAMQESELGEIPEGWEFRKLANICKVLNGRAYKNSEFKDSGIPIVRIQNLSGKGSTVFSDLDLPQDKLIAKEDFIYAWSATFGPFIWRGPKSIYHYHIWKMDVQEKIVSRYFLYLTMFRKTEHMKNAGTGSIFTHLTKRIMEEQDILIGSQRINDRFSSIVYPIFKQISSLNDELINLENMRDVLLPKLLSGELRLPEVEGQIQEAADAV